MLSSAMLPSRVVKPSRLSNRSLCVHAELRLYRPDALIGSV